MIELDAAECNILSTAMGIAAYLQQCGERRIRPDMQFINKSITLFEDQMEMVDSAGLAKKLGRI